MDIVKRLHVALEQMPETPPDYDTVSDAVDEIVRLRDENSRLRAALPEGTPVCD